MAATMTLFEYLSVAFSIVLSLAAVRLLSGIRPTLIPTLRSNRYARREPRQKPRLESLPSMLGDVDARRRLHGLVLLGAQAFRRVPELGV